RRPRVDGKMHVAFDKRKVECFNCHNTGHFARECKFKGSKEGNRQEAGKGQNFKPVQIKKEALMTIDEGQINWVEQTEDEELNHALMAFTVTNEVSMCSKLCLDSFNALQAKYDELQSEFGDQEAALLAHKLAVKKLESQLRLKKYRRIGMKAVKDKAVLQKIVDSCPLGKFDGKSDEGFLVGYSVNSKAFRVYNLVTKRVEVNLHVNFLEEKPNVQGIGHRWMFDLDYLTDSMNYIPVSLQNQANPAGSKEVIDIDVQTEEAAELMVVSSTSLTGATRKAASADDIMAFRKELDALALRHLGPVPTTAPTSTNPVNTGSDNLNTVS
ncbi:retrovirus-related pol polyprotein from transposon TNT 1-94, partial [Tanacetum coccineum]